MTGSIGKCYRVFGHVICKHESSLFRFYSLVNHIVSSRIILSQLKVSLITQTPWVSILLSKDSINNYLTDYKVNDASRLGLVDIFCGNTAGAEALTIDLHLLLTYTCHRSLPENEGEA